MRIRGKAEDVEDKYHWTASSAKNLSVRIETSNAGVARSLASHNSHWVSLGLADQVSVAGVAHPGIASAV